MPRIRWRPAPLLFAPLLVVILTGVIPVPASLAAGEANPDAAARLVSAMLGPSPATEDLRFLCDRIGGRPTGSAACERSVDWLVSRFREAGIKSVTTESFAMPLRWEEGGSQAHIISP